MLVLGGDLGKASKVPGRRYTMVGENVIHHVSNSGARGEEILKWGVVDPKPSMRVMGKDLEPWKAEFG